MAGSSGRRAALRVAAPGIAVAVAVAGTLYAMGRWRIVLLLLGVAGIALVSALLVPTVVLNSLAAVRRLAEKVAAGLVVVAMSLVWVIGVLPAWAWHRLGHTAALDDGWGRADSAWRTTGSARLVDGRVEAPYRTATREPERGPHGRSSRRRRRVVAIGLGMVAVLLSLSLTGNGPLNRMPILGGPLILAGHPLDDYAHEDEPWIEAYAKEQDDQQYLWDPFVGSRLVDMSGRYVNVVDGRRVSYQPTNPEMTVWFFGGSTTYGVGQRDGYTIPSMVARLAEADDIRIRPVNFGVSSYVNWQETMLMAEALHTEERPDLIVFYDGVNEGGTSFSRLTQGDPNPDHNFRLVTSPQEQALLDQSFPPNKAPVEATAASSLTAAQYRRGVLVGRTLAAEAGVEIVHFWQPRLDTKKFAPADRPAFERIGALPPSQSRKWVDPVLPLADVDVVDLTAAFDQLTEPVFIDWGHTNELGARVAAEAIYQHLRPDLERLAADA